MIQRTIRLAVVLAASTAAAAIAQTVSANGVLVSGAPITLPAAVNGFSGSSGVMSFTSAGPLSNVTGKPYSAQEETETIQTLADGTHITNGTQKVSYYRDSMGRTRSERTAMQPPGFPGTTTPPVFIEIVDPVGGYRYSFDSNSHTAHRLPSQPIVRTMPMHPSPPPPPGTSGTATGKAMFASSNAGNPPPAQLPRPEISNENLGTQTIEGVLAEGTRMTTVYPIGVLGNDRPISSVRETWTSRDLGMAVLTKTSDPRFGDTTKKLTNISQSEPSPSLFQPPADYEIVDPPEQR